MVSARKLASVLYKELFYQGYFASRISGLRPMNVSRVVRTARHYKLVMSAMMGFYMGLFGAMQYFIFKMPGPSLFALTLTFSFIMIYSLLINLAFPLQGADNIRGLLATLPLEPGLVRRALALSLYMTMDLPIYISIAVSVVLSLVVGGVPYPLIGALEGIPLGVVVSMGFILMAERTMKGKVGGNVVRVLSLVLITVLIMLMVYIDNIKPSELNPALSIVPIVSGLFITGLGIPLYVTLMYIALFSALAYVMLRKVSIRLFESIVQVVRVKAFRGFRVRSPLMALVRVDLVQSFRSRIAGLWALPISFWLIVFFAMIISGVKLTPMSVLAYVWQMSLVIAFIPFILYTSELRGAVVFRLLPISPIRNLVSKLIVTLIAYYIAAAPMIIMALLYRMPLSLQVPILLAFGPPMAATAVMAILFEKSISEGAMPSILTMFIYGLMVILAEGLPTVSLIVALVLIGGYVIPALVMFAVSMIEFAVALVVLARLGRH
jgi:hypothetical protein